MPRGPRPAPASAGALARTPVNRIDAGLGQVNLGYHAHRYAHPCELLDPYRNLAIAAEILQEQHTPGEDWLVAIGRYHRPAGGAPAGPLPPQRPPAPDPRARAGSLTSLCPESHAMNRILVAATAALLATTADAQDRGPVTKNSSPPLIVVEDKGGTSALPYYRALNPQDAQPGQPATPQTKPRIGGPAEAEAAMLPVRSMRLTPGDEPRRVIRAPGLTPLFLIGDDDRSRAWLQRRGKDLQALRAVGLVVNVATPEALAALRRLAPGLMLSPASGDELAQRLGAQALPGADHRHRHRALT